MAMPTVHLYQSVTTRGVYGTSNGLKYRASPKSHSFRTPLQSAVIPTLTRDVERPSTQEASKKENVVGCMPVSEQQVGQLEVPVQHPIGMQERDCAQQLLQQALDLRFAEGVAHAVHQARQVVR